MNVDAIYWTPIRCRGYNARFVYDPVIEESTVGTATLEGFSPVWLVSMNATSTTNSASSTGYTAATNVRPRVFDVKVARAYGLWARAVVS